MSLFSMNLIYGCLRYMKALEINRIKMVVSVVSVVHSMRIFFSSEIKKPVLSIESVPSGDLLF